MKKRFRSGIKTARTRTFPGADVGSDRDMVIMTFQTHLKNSRKPIQPRIRFDLEKLNDPTVVSTFQATIDGIFAPLATLVDEDADLESKKISNDQELIQSDPISCPQNQKGNN